MHSDRCHIRKNDDISYGPTSSLVLWSKSFELLMQGLSAGLNSERARFQQQCEPMRISKEDTLCLLYPMPFQPSELLISFYVALGVMTAHPRPHILSNCKTYGISLLPMARQIHVIFLKNTKNLLVNVLPHISQEMSQKYFGFRFHLKTDESMSCSSLSKADLGGTSRHFSQL